MTFWFRRESHPTAWPVVEDGVRRRLVSRFPFGVLYSLEPEGVFVLAVTHPQASRLLEEQVVETRGSPV